MTAGTESAVTQDKWANDRREILYRIEEARSEAEERLLRDKLKQHDNVGARSSTPDPDRTLEIRAKRI